MRIWFRRRKQMVCSKQRMQILTEKSKKHRFIAIGNEAVKYLTKERPKWIDPSGSIDDRIRSLGQSHKEKAQGESSEGEKKEGETNGGTGWRTSNRVLRRGWRRCANEMGRLRGTPEMLNSTGKTMTEVHGVITRRVFRVIKPAAWHCENRWFFRSAASESAIRQESFDAPRHVVEITAKVALKNPQNKRETKIHEFDKRN